MKTGIKIRFFLSMLFLSLGKPNRVSVTSFFDQMFILHTRSCRVRPPL